MTRTITAITVTHASLQHWEDGWSPRIGGGFHVDALGYTLDEPDEEVGEAVQAPDREDYEDGPDGDEAYRAACANFEDDDAAWRENHAEVELWNEALETYWDRFTSRVCDATEEALTQAGYSGVVVEFARDWEDVRDTAVEITYSDDDEADDDEDLDEEARWERQCEREGARETQEEDDRRDVIDIVDSIDYGSASSAADDDACALILWERLGRPDVDADALYAAVAALGYRNVTALGDLTLAINLVNAGITADEWAALPGDQRDPARVATLAALRTGTTAAR